MPVTFESLIARIASPSSECLLGLALIAEGKRTPLYDVLTVAMCFTNMRSEISAERAQSALESLEGFDLARLEAVIPELAPSGKLRLVIITDVGLRTVGTVDTDDWVALVCLCDIVRLMCAQLDYLTVVLSHRKKAADRTEPEDVSKLMAARIGGTTRLDDTTFVAYGTTVRVLQQHRQSTPNSAQRALSVDEMLVGNEESAKIRAELEVANETLYAHLRDVHLAEEQNTVVFGCGPIDVLTAKILQSCAGWTISYGDDVGVNSGRSHAEYQHSNCGAAVFASYKNIVDVTIGVTRGTTTTDDVIERVCDTPMLVALSENTTKVAARPLKLRAGAPSFQAMQSAKLFWRIFASNVDTLLPNFWHEFQSAPTGADVAQFCARASGASFVPQCSEIVAYSLWFGITHVANTLLAARAPLRADLALQQLAGATACNAPEVDAYGELPAAVLELLASSVPRARVLTAADLLSVATLAVASRLAFAMHTASKFGIVGVDVQTEAPTPEFGGLALNICDPLVFL
jgi:hypothetical protein